MDKEKNIQFLKKLKELNYDIKQIKNEISYFSGIHNHLYNLHMIIFHSLILTYDKINEYSNLELIELLNSKEDETIVLDYFKDDEIILNFVDAILKQLTNSGKLSECDKWFDKLFISYSELYKKESIIGLLLLETLFDGLPTEKVSSIVDRIVPTKASQNLKQLTIVHSIKYDNIKEFQMFMKKSKSQREAGGLIWKFVCYYDSVEIAKHLLEKKMENYKLSLILNGDTSFEIACSYFAINVVSFMLSDYIVKTSSEITLQHLIDHYESDRVVKTIQILTKYNIKINKMYPTSGKYTFLGDQELITKHKLEKFDTTDSLGQSYSSWMIDFIENGCNLSIVKSLLENYSDYGKIELDLTNYTVNFGRLQQFVLENRLELLQLIHTYCPIPAYYREHNTTYKKAKDPKIVPFSFISHNNKTLKWLIEIHGGIDLIKNTKIEVSQWLGELYDFGRTDEEHNLIMDKLFYLYGIDYSVNKGQFSVMTQYIKIFRCTIYFICTQELSTNYIIYGFGY